LGKPFNKKEAHKLLYDLQRKKLKHNARMATLVPLSVAKRERRKGMDKSPEGSPSQLTSRYDSGVNVDKVSSASDGLLMMPPGNSRARLTD
jgi:hypothetical protein